MASEAAFRALTKVLINDSFAPISDDERPGQPQLSLQKTGPFLAGLNQINDNLNCLALGNIRPELFLEITWKNLLTEAPETEVTPYEMSPDHLVLSVAGVVFDVRYVSVRRWPLDVQDELRHWNRVRDCFVGNDTLRWVYAFLVSWASHRGVRGVEYLLDELKISRLLMESSGVSVSKLLKAGCDCEVCRRRNSQTDDGEVDFLVALKRFFLHFFFQISVQDAMNWSRSVYVEAQNMLQRLKHDGEATFEKDDPLRVLRSRNCTSYIRISVQYLGNSKISCGSALKQVEADLQALGKRLKLVQNAYFHLWPQALLSEDAVMEEVLPYEGFYLIGIEPTGQNEKPKNTVLSSAQLIVDHWNSEPVPDLIVHADFLTSEEIMKHGLKRSEIVWPRSVAVPGPEIKNLTAPVEIIYSAPRKLSKTPTTTTTRTTTPTTKLRPALDILHRLRHDPSHNLDDYIIGYQDRHSGILERDAKDWVSESSHAEWIPQHKILYFRRRDGRRVWERERRFDEVFG